MKKLLNIAVIMSLILTCMPVSKINVQAESKEELSTSITGKEIENEETPAPPIGISKSEQTALDNEKLIEITNTIPPRQPINKEKTARLKNRDTLYPETPAPLISTVPTEELKKNISLPKPTNSSTGVNHNKSSTKQKSEIRERDFQPGVVLLGFKEPYNNVSLKEVFPELHIMESKDESLALYEAVKGADYKEITIDGVSYTK